MTPSPWRRGAVVLGHFCVQALLCTGLWILVGRAYDLTGYPGRLGLAVLLLLTGCIGLGVLGRLLDAGRLVVSTAVGLVSMVVLTEVFRVYVVDFAGGPPTFWVTLRTTAAINAPYAAGLSLVPLAGWYGTRALQRRRHGTSGGSDGAA